jgi:hypothetical protein
MSVTQDVDLLLNAFGFAALVWLSAATVIRWMHTGRIESYSVDALLPKELQPWVRWLLAPTFVMTPAPSSSGSKPHNSWSITPWGWLYLSGLAVWFLVKALNISR